MWSSWVKEKGTTQVICIAKLKDGPKSVRKLSQWFWKGFLKWYDRGEKMESHRKQFLKLKCFSPLKILTSPLFEETLGAFLFLFSFFFSLFCSVSWGLGVLMIFEEKITSSKTSFQMTWHGMAWLWLWIYWRWMHIPEWRYARQNFWVRLANHFRKNFKTQMDTSHNKAQHNKSRYVDNIWLW
jgi:hypothetical protein